jgi:hypothetical protein
MKASEKVEKENNDEQVKEGTIWVRRRP